MPFHRRAVFRILHVQLGPVQPHIGPEQARQDADHLGTFSEVPEYRVYGMGLFDAAHTRRLRGVRRLQIVNVVVLGDAFGLRHEVGNHRLHLGQRCFVDHVFYEQITVVAVERDVAIRYHLGTSR